MLKIRKSDERGKTLLPWLDSRHSFSFGEYYDPEMMGFGVLRVINEDKIEPGQGFGRHPHKNMEILTYVVEGAIQHQDSLGTIAVIKAGEIQRMTAGSGIQHSEFNHSSLEKLHLLQIWIIPDQMNLRPSYEQKTIPQKKNALILLASNQPTAEAVTIHQAVQLYGLFLESGKSLTCSFQSTQKGFIQLIKGEIQVNDTKLESGDGLFIENEEKIQIKGIDAAELLFFYLNHS